MSNVIAGKGGQHDTTELGGRALKATLMRLRRLLAKLTPQACLVWGKRHGLPGTIRLDIACRWEGVLS